MHDRTKAVIDAAVEELAKIIDQRADKDVGLRLLLVSYAVTHLLVWIHKGSTPPSCTEQCGDCDADGQLSLFQ